MPRLQFPSKFSIFQIFDLMDQPHVMFHWCLCKFIFRFVHAKPKAETQRTGKKIQITQTNLQVWRISRLKPPRAQNPDMPYGRPIPLLSVLLQKLALYESCIYIYIFHILYILYYMPYIILQAGGKPSTWLPPGGLAEWLQVKQLTITKSKASTKKTNPCGTSSRNMTRTCTQRKTLGGTFQPKTTRNTA